MTRKATKENLENALLELAKYLPDENLALEQFGQRFRIIRQDHSRPFGSDYHSKDTLHSILWSVIVGLQLAR